MRVRKKYTRLIIIVALVCSMCACKKDVMIPEESTNSTEAENFNELSVERTEETPDETFLEREKDMLFLDDPSTEEEDAAEQWKKGYDLPIDEQEREVAVADCKQIMESYTSIYEEKGTDLHPVLKQETIFAIQEKIMETGYPVATLIAYSDMKNYEKFEQYLQECMAGNSGSIVVYVVHDDGGLGRVQYKFDGTDMYVLSTNGVWEHQKPEIAYISYTRVKEWRYTGKGWFCYELCVQESPEVSEIVDGSCLIRVKPMTEELRKMSEKCVQGLGYKGNNVLCSNWDIDHMEGLDYNGMYEYLYEMKYRKKLQPDNYSNGIPKEEFESLIMEYFPVTPKQIRQYAAFDKEKQTYLWVPYGSVHYSQSFFATSLPEVTDIKENEDGTVTLTVDAVCDMVICDDAVITHELTVRFAGDGSFQYLGNRILHDGIKDIPDYQYRIFVPNT